MRPPMKYMRYDAMCPLGAQRGFAIRCKLKNAHYCISSQRIEAKMLVGQKVQGRKKREKLDEVIFFQIHQIAY